MEVREADVVFLSGEENMEMEKEATSDSHDPNKTSPIPQKNEYATRSTIGATYHHNMRAGCPVSIKWEKEDGKEAVLSSF
jgi:hypothetical protein